MYDVRLGPEMDATSFRSRITVRDDNGERSYLDSGEPEDNCFTRDYNWIEAELNAAYRQGKKDAMRKLHEFLASA